MISEAAKERAAAKAKELTAALKVVHQAMRATNAASLAATDLTTKGHLDRAWDHQREAEKRLIVDLYDAHQVLEGDDA